MVHPHPPIILNDLSSKIAEKTMLKPSGDQTTSNPSSSSVTELKEKFKNTNVKKKKKNKKRKTLVNVETKNDDGEPKGSDATIETDPSEKSHNNIILRKLLRGPRYFDPPDTAANCTLVKRRKPCFVCGSLEHNVKQCNKGKICKKDCPEKSNCGFQSTVICLNCGDSGHEMFSCKNTYSSDDLKEIQCYVCKCFGHLCCVKYASEGSREVSCYRCGQLGHSGRDCAKVHAEKSSNWTPSLCYMCRKETHTVCKCTDNSKKEKRKRVSSTPKKENKKKKKKKNKNKKKDSTGKYGNELGASSTPQLNPTGRGGWITGDPGAYNHNHNHNHGLGSPMTPMYISNNTFQFHSGHGYHSPNDSFQFHGGNSYQSPNDSFQFHGGNGYQPPNIRFQFHGGNGYQPPNNGFQFHGASGYNSGYNGPGFHGNPGMYHAAGSNGYQQSRFGNSSNYGSREYGWGS